ncbi:GNAT family N-acetyltransferase [Kribbella deserti]|uniref:GNAT family N-acetyltransferase n=1 Tax=Kribbella deserti TaxID=1926257 RepID=A0ABV6QL22_9ACTN
MGFGIRKAGTADAAGIAAVWARTTPYLVKTPAGIAAELAKASRRVVFVAVENDVVVGYGNAWAPDDAGRSRIAVQVPPEHGRRGIGAAMAETVIGAAAGIGATTLITVTNDDEPSKRFATDRGFTMGRELAHAKAPLDQLPEAVPPPPGFDLVTYDALEPRTVWQATSGVVEGDPSGLSAAPPFEEWLATDWDHPDLAKDLSIAVLADGEVASFVTTTADADRQVIWSNLTGTLPKYRGQGLAKVVKSAALHRAREAGFVAAYTGNDADNRPMLAVNRWLGYERGGVSWTATRPL